jgi:hypothetical protein
MSVLTACIEELCDCYHQHTFAELLGLVVGLPTSPSLARLTPFSLNFLPVDHPATCTKQ